ncbi:hypothetical protein [Desulfotomaculum sp. 1211_IL3151]|uniref:hypothetical protein n=1 Tax=Desulfotomaculum sp. 1211_IL3151 TaxID=3084055 RepID=UPI002FDAB2B8
MTDKQIRLTTVEELAQYLENLGDQNQYFRAIPISGTPEEFLYKGQEKAVLREKDQRLFDNLEDFICYAFQCDPEGYSHTEYVDLEILKDLR